ncbi:hypothetical protein [uncultured Brevundimonas sp.]|uniref:hypothetical protein n=1 Tax=uncultured Brevundimonas sp. TaxID=213418 RepID=UPI00260F60F6|nr:hypothetical protein [uncultured Brevundimonas sp.]
MISRPGWIVLIALTGLAQATPAAADYTLADVMVSSVREGRIVARGRTDARGDFRLHLPAGPSGADEICLNGRSARLAIARASSGPGAGDRRRAGTLVELRVATLNRRVREMNDPPQIHQQRLVVPASRVRAGRQAGSADLCFRPFAGLAEGQRPGIEPATTRRGASGPRTPLPGSGGDGPDGRESDGGLRNAAGVGTPPRNNGDGTVTDPNDQAGHVAALTRDCCRELPEREEDRDRRNRLGSDTRPPPADVDGDGRLTRSGPPIPPPGGRSRAPTLVIGSIRVVNWP